MLPAGVLHYPTHRLAYLHRHDRPAARQHALALLRTYLPQHERALQGWRDIAEYLATIGLSRHDGRPVTQRTLTRWRRDHGLPVVPGRNRLAPAWTTTHLLTAWAASRFDALEPARRVA